MAFFNNTGAHDSQLRRKKSVNSLHKEKSASSKTSVDTQRSADGRTSTSSRPSPIEGPTDMSSFLRTSADDKERQYLRPSLEASSLSGLTSKRTKRGGLTSVTANLVIHVPPANDRYDTPHHDHLATPASPRNLNSAVKRPATSPSSPSRLIDLHSPNVGIDRVVANPYPSASRSSSPAMNGHSSPIFVGQVGGRGPTPPSPLPIAPGPGPGPDPSVSNTVPPSPSPSPSLHAHYVSPTSNASPTARSFTSAHSSPVRRVPVPPAYDPNELHPSVSAGASLNPSASRSTSALGYATGSGSRSGSTSNLSHSADGASIRLAHAFAHAYAHVCAPSPTPGGYQAATQQQQSLLQKKPRNILRKASLTRKPPPGSQPGQLPSAQQEPNTPMVDSVTAAAIATAVAVVDATGAGHVDKEKENQKTNRARSKSAMLSRPFKSSSKDKDKDGDGKRSHSSSAHHPQVESTFEMVAPMPPQAQGETPLTPAKEVVMAYYQEAAERKNERKESKEGRSDAGHLDSGLNATVSEGTNDNGAAADVAATGASTTSTTTTAASADMSVSHDPSIPPSSSQTQPQPLHALDPQPGDLNPLTSTTGKLVAVGSPSDTATLDSDRLSLSRLSYTAHSDASSTRSFNVGLNALSKHTRSLTGSRSAMGSRAAQIDPTDNFAVGGKSTWLPPWGSEGATGAGPDGDVNRGGASVDNPREREKVKKRPSTAGAAFGGGSSVKTSIKESPSPTPGAFRTLSRKLSTRFIPTLSQQLAQETQSSSQSNRKASLPYTPTFSQSQPQQNATLGPSPRARHIHSHSQGHTGKRRSLSGALDFFTAGLGQTSSTGRVHMPMGVVVTPKPTVQVSSRTASARRPQTAQSPRLGGWPGHQDGAGGDSVNEHAGIHADLGMGSYVDGRGREKRAGEGHVWEDSVGDWVTRQKRDLQKNKNDSPQSHGLSVSSPSSPTVSNSKRLWRLVKRFSSGNLKDKKATMTGKGDDVPPVPLLPPLPPLPVPKDVVQIKEKEKPRRDESEVPTTTSPKAIPGNTASTIISNSVQTPRRWRSATATTGSSSSPSSASATTSGMFPRSRSGSAAGSESSYGEDIKSIPPVPVPELPLLHQKGGELREGKSEDDGRVVLVGGGGGVLRKRTGGSRTTGGDGGDKDGEGLLPSPAGSASSATIPTFDLTNPVNFFSSVVSRKTSGSDSSTSTKRQTEPSRGALPPTTAWPGSEHLHAQSGPPVPPKNIRRKQPMADTRLGTSATGSLTRRPSGGNVQLRPEPKSEAPRPRSMSDGDIAAEQERKSHARPQDNTVAAHPPKRSGDTRIAATTTTRLTRTESPGPSFMFRELSSPAAREILTEQEKTAKWEDLLQKSARAGGTLHVVDASMSSRRRVRRRSHDSGGLGVSLWSDERSSLRTSLAISETSSLAGDLAA